MCFFLQLYSYDNELHYLLIESNSMSCLGNDESNFHRNALQSIFREGNITDWQTCKNMSGIVFVVSIFILRFINTDTPDMTNNLCY